MKNKALAALEPMIGEWEYTMYNSWFLESMDSTIKGTATIDGLHQDKRLGGRYVQTSAII